MQGPVQVTFHGIDSSPAIEQRIRSEVERLTQFYDRIMSARVTVSRPEQKHHRAAPYRIQIDVEIPGTAPIIVNRDPGVSDRHDDVNLAISDAFKAAERQLRQLAERRQP